MDYLHTDLGYRKKGEIVVVTQKGGSMSVGLSRLHQCESLRPGQAAPLPRWPCDQRPTWWLSRQRPLARSNRPWRVAGRVQASVWVVVEPLPESRSSHQPRAWVIRPPFANQVENVQADLGPHWEPEYDVFISHAAEGKDGMIRTTPPEPRLSFRIPVNRVSTTLSAR
jgi:hypothetical protein